MKQPHIQFYTGDWLKDPELSVCSPATRGVWIDLLCAMHERDRCGELRGTSEQITRLARCSTVELEAALTDLQNNRAAVVEYRNGSWLIANRRMREDARMRRVRADCGSLGGSKAQANRIANSEQNSDNDNDSLSFEETEKLFFGRWNDVGPRRAEKITSSRRTSLRQRWAEPYFRDNHVSALAKMQKSAFCNGVNDRNWKADVEWFLRPDTVVRIMEGKYDGNGVSPKGEKVW